MSGKPCYTMALLSKKHSTMIVFVLSTWNHIQHVLNSTRTLLFFHLRCCNMFFSICVLRYLNPNYISAQGGRQELACAHLYLCELHRPICVTLKRSSPLNTMTHCDEQSCIDARSLPQSCVRLGSCPNLSLNSNRK